MPTGKEGREKIGAGLAALQTAIFIEYNRNVKKLLTGEYLGVFTGMGRNTTAAIKDNGGIVFGTMPDYMGAFETGDWSGVKEDPESRRLYFQKFHGRRNSKWTGNRKHRPFLKDTIEDIAVQARILERYKKNDNV